MSLTASAAGTVTIGERAVHRLGFGAMRITGPGVWGPPEDRAEAIRVLQRAVELGITFIDTANSYGPHVSEELIAEALFPYPTGLMVATKGGFDRPGPGEWRTNGQPKRLREELEGSLRRLKVDCIDLYQLHRIDPAVPEDEQFETLATFHREGKVRYLGLSEVSMEQIARARRTLPIVSIQNRYNIVDRQSDEIVDYCERERIAFIPWYPLLVGKVAQANTLVQVSARRGATALQVALAWLLMRSPAMLPIPGTSKVTHLEENVGAASLRLSRDEFALLS